MSMLRVCSEPGCGTLTLGRFCIDHEVLPARGTTANAGDDAVEDADADGLVEELGTRIDRVLG